MNNLLKNFGEIMIEVEIVTGRTLDQGASVEEKLSEKYFNSVNFIELSEEDFNSLNLNDGDKVKVTTKYGCVTVYAKKAKLPKGLAFIPMGPYANQITGIDTEGTGMPRFKGVRGKVEKTEERVPTIKEIVEAI